MKANNRRKVFGDAVDLLMEDIEEKTAPGGLRMLSIKKIRPFHDHPFHLYEGDRLEDMVVSVREHGILNPVIVQEIDGGYEMLSGHNRMNAAIVSVEGCKIFSYITIESLDGSSFGFNCHRRKGYQDFIRSDMPGLKIVSAHIEVFDHFPVHENRYKTFSVKKREIIVTATVVVVVVVIG